MQHRAVEFDYSVNPLAVTTMHTFTRMRDALGSVDVAAIASDIDDSLIRASTIVDTASHARARVARAFIEAEHARQSFVDAYSRALDEVEAVMRDASNIKRSEFSLMLDRVALRTSHTPNTFDASVTCYLCASPIEHGQMAWLECQHDPVPTCRQCLEQAVYSLSDNARRTSIKCTHCRNELAFDSVRFV